jgi:Flp pilus assembly protein TadG
MRNRFRRLRSSARRGAIIVEFALVVPFISLIVFGVIDFSRAYGQVNALNSSLREAARFLSHSKVLEDVDYTTAGKNRVQMYATQYGFSGLDLSKISVTLTVGGDGVTTEFVTVAATGHPIPLQILGRFLGVPNLSVTRSASFRWECAGMTALQCK